MRRLSHLSWLVAVLAAPLAAAPPPVGLAQGLSVRLRRTLERPEAELTGQLLPVQASRTAEPWTVVLQHGATLGESTRHGAEAVAQWLSGAEAEGLPGLTAAFGRHGLQLRFAANASPVDGGSAGLALAVAAVSALLELPVSQEVAFSGVVAEGRVQAVAGADLKLAAAVREGFSTIVLPLANARELVAAAPLETLARIRVVGVEELAPALFEAFGEGGPLAAEYRDYHDLYRAGLESLATGDTQAAAERLAACVEYQPNDLAAAWFLAQCASGGNDSLLRAAALRRLRRLDEAVAEARLATVGGPDPYLLDRFLADCRREGAIGERCRRLDELAEALTLGNLPAARAALTAAEATLPSAPDGDEALARAAAALTRAERRQAVAARPDDGPAWLALADAALAVGDWAEVSEAARRAREAGPDQPLLRYRESQGWLKRGEPGQARQLLTANLGDWPAHLPSRELVSALGADLLPAVPSASLLAGDQVDASTRVEAGAPEAGARLTMLLDGRPVASGEPPRVWRWPAAERGPHWFTVVARDRAGNLAQRRLPVAAGRGSPPPARGVVGAPEPVTVHLVEAGGWLVRPGDRLLLRGQELFADALRVAGCAADGLRLGAGDTRGEPGGDLEITPAAWPQGVQEVEVWGQLPSGPAIGPARLRLIRNTTLLASIRSPRPGATIRRPERLELLVDPGFEPLLATLLVDGQRHHSGPPTALRLEPARLAPGRHELAVVLTSSDGRNCQTPGLLVSVDGAPSARAGSQ